MHSAFKLYKILNSMNITSLPVSEIADSERNSLRCSVGIELYTEYVMTVVWTVSTKATLVLPFSSNPSCQWAVKSQHPKKIEKYRHIKKERKTPCEWPKLRQHRCFFTDVKINEVYCLICNLFSSRTMHTLFDGTPFSAITVSSIRY